jgi:hypothetical protein
VLLLLLVLVLVLVMCVHEIIFFVHAVSDTVRGDFVDVLVAVLGLALGGVEV